MIGASAYWTNSILKKYDDDKVFVSNSMMENKFTVIA